jgi:hypothetical protein
MVPDNRKAIAKKGSDTMKELVEEDVQEESQKEKKEISYYGGGGSPG